MNFHRRSNTLIISTTEIKTRRITKGTGMPKKIINLLNLFKSTGLKIGKELLLT